MSFRGRTRTKKNETNSYALTFPSYSLFLFTCGVVPVSVVAADVVVEELGFEPLCAESPVQAQVLDQEAGHVLTPAI